MAQQPREPQPTPTPQKSYRTILKQEIIAGLMELRRPATGLLLSSFSAGLDIGFSVLLMASAITLFQADYGEPITLLITANMYAVGFILVVLGRSELFTEHTALAVLPVLDGQSSLGELARVWVLVFIGNIAGAAIFAGIIWWVTPRIGVIELWAYERLAGRMVDHPWWVILVSAVLAGWLMGELAWLLAASRDTISQIVCVWIVTAGIGFAHLHHVVVGSVEVLAGVFSSDQYTMGDFARFLVWTTLGNALGGVFFVAIIKYGHASRGGDEEDAHHGPNDRDGVLGDDDH